MVFFWTKKIKCLHTVQQSSMTIFYLLIFLIGLLGNQLSLSKLLLHDGHAILLSVALIFKHFAYPKIARLANLKSAVCQTFFEWFFYKQISKSAFLLLFESCVECLMHTCKWPAIYLVNHWKQNDFIKNSVWPNQKINKDFIWQCTFGVIMNLSKSAKLCNASLNCL